MVDGDNPAARTASPTSRSPKSPGCGLCTTSTRALSRRSRSGIFQRRVGLPIWPSSLETEREDAMHKIAIPSYAIDRALSRRGRLHPFDGLDPACTALIVVDLQNGFMAPGQPAEIAQAREIVPNVNCLAAATRASGGTVVWIQNTTTAGGDKSWSIYLDNFANAEWGPR